MKKHISKRVLTLVLALVLVFALSLGAFAAWTQFQDNKYNNGVISTATPITNPQTVLRVGLPTNDPYNPAWYSNSVWNSVDVTPLISGGKAYTLYNGGVTNGTLGGARLGITDLATGDTSSLQITGNASNSFLLSTPVIAGSDIYAAVTDLVFFDITEPFDSTHWPAVPPTGMHYEDTFLAFDDNATGSVESTGYDIDFSYPMNTFTMFSDVTTGNGTPVNYSLTLKDSNNVTYPVVVNETAPGTGVSIITYNGATIPAGHYKLIVTIGAHTFEGKFWSVTFKENGWSLFKIEDFATNPNVSRVQDSTNTDISYPGQANTPITYDGTYLYWGVYGGTKSYYQLNLNNSALAVFDANDDFYLAGATVMCGYAYFGGDSGTLYKRDINAFASSGTSVNVGAGKIRSSVATDGTSLYFTTQSPTVNDAGTVKKYSTALTEEATHDLADGSDNFSSTSTPVISSNGYVYVGAYFGYTDGRVFAFDTGLSLIDTVYSGDPVQASPIVYSIATGAQSNRKDYVYFTTNSGTGAGYCYSMMKLSQAVAFEWTAGGASGNRYAIQGFAADDGYLVYGDDGGMLYIIH